MVILEEARNLDEFTKSKAQPVQQKWTIL